MWSIEQRNGCGNKKGRDGVLARESGAEKEGGNDGEGRR